MLKKFLGCLFVFCFAFILVSCQTCSMHIDADKDSICDKCGATIKKETSIKDDFDCITIKEAIEIATLAGEAGTSEKYYIYGTIVEVSNSMYGSMTIDDGTGSLYVYGVYSKDETTRYDALEERPVAGDEVVLYGVLKTYKGTPELDRGYLQTFNHEKVEIDSSEYTSYSVEEARELEAGKKVKLSGVVAQITYAFGQIPNGFYLVDNTGSIYIYGKETAGQVRVGNTVTIIGEKTYYVLEAEQENAEKYGYKGCCQVQDVTLLENDNKVSDYDKSWIETSSVKEIMETEISSNITTNTYKVIALVKKVEGTGFINYYINDLDGYTGSYVYTACSGSDFAWLDQYDGKICTVYLSPINAKSTSSGCFYRFVPIEVVVEDYEFDESSAPQFALEYYAKDQFLNNYESDPASNVLSAVDNELLGLENITFKYASNNEEVVYFETTEEGIIFHTNNEGVATVTITAEYKEYSANIEVEITVSKPIDYETITVEEAINSEDGTEVTVRGIVASSLVNQSGFYLIDDTGVIAVVVPESEVSLLSSGDEVVIRGTKSHKVKDGYTGAGQINIYNSTVLVNYYGNHEYSTATFDSTKTLEELYNLDHNEDHSTEVYVVKAIIKVIEDQHYTSIKLESLDGSVQISLYCSSANQYSFLKQFAGQEVTLELAMCNWNSKKYYAGCVISVTSGDTKIINTLNFSE